MKKKNVEWDKIKHEYISSNTSYRKLAEKYNVAFGTLRKRAAKEKWVEKRNIYRHKTDTKIIEKSSENRSDTLVDLEEKILEAEKLVLIDATNTLHFLGVRSEKSEEELAKCRYTTQKTIESALNVIHKIKYPPDNEKKDNNVTFVMGKEFKEYFN